VTAGNDVFHARKVVCCVGAWSRSALPFLSKLIRLEQHLLHWYEADASFDLTQGFRPFVVAPDDHQFLYGFPRIDASVKLADHFTGAALATPAALGANIPAAEFAHIDATVRRYMPALEQRIQFKPCLYDLSPDEHFILDQHPEMPGVWFFTGSSGHGFKFAPVIGEALANAALERPQQIDTGCFALKRFG
jgi:glycine/D-amino acid oxidase-like deaminating enzyme